ncbi:MAG: PadR family transcriptional regulator [Candidatus Hermodarchaeota archaeon]
MDLLDKWVQAYRKGFIKPVILLILSDGESYPYRLTKQVPERTANHLSIKTSNIYPVLKDLEKDGLIKEMRVEMESKRLRVYYSLTKEGKSFLDELRMSLNEFTKNILSNFSTNGGV